MFFVYTIKHQQQEYLSSNNLRSTTCSHHPTPYNTAATLSAALPQSAVRSQIYHW